MSRFDIDRKKAGIYRIINLINNKVYIGSAISFRKRWNTHHYDLQKNKHHSILLQRAWNKYGELNFKFEVIEEITDLTKLIEREQYWMDYYKSYLSENGYNVGKIAGSRLGVKHSEETRKLLASKHIGRVYKPHSGPIHTDEFKEKRRKFFTEYDWSTRPGHPNPRKGTTITVKNCFQCGLEMKGLKCDIKRKKYCSQICVHLAQKVI